MSSMQYQLQQVQNNITDKCIPWSTYSFNPLLCHLVTGSKLIPTTWDGQKRSVSGYESQPSYMDALQSFFESYIQQEDEEPSENFKKELQKYSEEHEGGQLATRVQQVESKTGKLCHVNLSCLWRNWLVLVSDELSGILARYTILRGYVQYQARLDAYTH